jgi:hypothetical protein
MGNTWIRRRCEPRALARRLPQTMTIVSCDPSATAGTTGTPVRNAQANEPPMVTQVDLLALGPRPTRLSVAAQVHEKHATFRVVLPSGQRVWVVRESVAWDAPADDEGDDLGLAPRVEAD